MNIFTVSIVVLYVCASALELLKGRIPDAAVWASFALANAAIMWAAAR